MNVIYWNKSYNRGKKMENAGKHETLTLHGPLVSSRTNKKK